MKSQFRILLAILFSAFMISCSNGDNSSNQELENEEATSSEPKFFNELLQLTQGLNQFEGTAFVGSLDGPCYMVLSSNSQNDNIAKLRYQINNYTLGTADKVDETYTITELERKSAKKDGFNLNNTRDYEDTYLYGSVEGYKASINDGAITDGSGSGNIWLVLDSVDYELTYVMASSANWSFQGSIKLEPEHYIKLKELFINKKLSENELKEISKSKEILKLTSNDSNFVSLGNNKYKVLISKKALVDNWTKHKFGPDNNGYSWCAKSEIKDLFHLNIKNISNKKIGKISIDQLYTLMNKSEEAEKAFWFMEGSTLWNSKTLNFNGENEISFNFDLLLSCSRLITKRGLEHLHDERTMEEVLQDPAFQKFWKKANARPAIANLRIFDNERQKWQDTSVEIYFELSEDLQTENININNTLLPQSIDYDGMPVLEYTINNEIIALDSYNENDSEGSYIRMRLNDKEVVLKMQKQDSSKARRVYSNSDYVVTFHDIIYGKCAGEGAQYLTGKLLIQTNSGQNTVIYEGYDSLYSSKECQEMGNG
jgi:hypothetical protein